VRVALGARPVGGKDVFESNVFHFVAPEVIRIVIRFEPEYSRFGLVCQKKYNLMMTKAIVRSDITGF
jgi:hypothetical protein